jgi:hypothetical protein
MSKKTLLHIITEYSGNIKIAPWPRIWGWLYLFLLTARCFLIQLEDNIILDTNFNCLITSTSYRCQANCCRNTYRLYQLSNWFVKTDMKGKLRIYWTCNLGQTIIGSDTPAWVGLGQKLHTVRNKQLAKRYTQPPGLMTCLAHRRDEK